MIKKMEGKHKTVKKHLIDNMNIPEIKQVD